MEVISKPDLSFQFFCAFLLFHIFKEFSASKLKMYPKKQHNRSKKSKFAHPFPNWSYDCFFFTFSNISSLACERCTKNTTTNNRQMFKKQKTEHLSTFSKNVRFLWLMKWRLFSIIFAFSNLKMYKKQNKTNMKIIVKNCRQPFSKVIAIKKFFFFVINLLFTFSMSFMAYRRCFSKKIYTQKNKKKMSSSWVIFQAFQKKFEKR